MGDRMIKTVFMFGFALSSLVTASAQINSGSSGQPRDIIRAHAISSLSRARVLGTKQDAGTTIDTGSDAVSTSLNQALAMNLPSGADSGGTKALETRPKPGLANLTKTRALPLAPNQIYRVGVGDVLDVKLLDMPTAKSTLFTVLEGGVLDYPLSNTPLAVAGLTSDEIAEQLKTRIKVLDNPRIAVKVRDYASHSVIVTGFVLDPGARFLRREASPLYVVLAEARPRSEALRATITRTGVPVINIDLKDQNSIATQILPGDVIRVLAPDPAPTIFFYTGGALNAPGQKTFHAGLTLTQAILASGGVTRTAGARVRVSRQGPDGRLAVNEYDLRQIEEGKLPDPQLQPGDRIAVGEGR